MKIALICPSNILYMPYLTNYENILKANNVSYEIFNWDRLHTEEINSNQKYRDKKIGHRRNFLDYHNYKKFLLKNLDIEIFDKVIVFGLQLAVFLRSLLKKNFKKNYIVDIRDHNKIINFYSIKNIIKFSDFVVLSSAGYLQWLPENGDYVINHNTEIENLSSLRSIAKITSSKKINISYIGALRDYKVNTDFMMEIKNSDTMHLTFHGEGIMSNKFEKYVKNLKLTNVTFTGRYNKIDEENLYRTSDLINVLRYNDDINNQTALPNRMYNAALHGKLMLALNGTFLAEQIKKFNLGIVLDNLNDVEKSLTLSLEKFDLKNYEKGRNSFFLEVFEDNIDFKERLLLFSKKLE